MVCMMPRLWVVPFRVAEGDGWDSIPFSRPSIKVLPFTLPLRPLGAFRLTPLGWCLRVVVGQALPINEVIL